MTICGERLAGSGRENVCQVMYHSDPNLVEIRHRIVRGGRKGEVNVSELQDNARRQEISRFLRFKALGVHTSGSPAFQPSSFRRNWITA